MTKFSGWRCAMPLLQTKFESLANKLGVAVAAADLEFNDVTVEFSPGTGGFGSPYIHVSVPSANPAHFILLGCSPDVAIGIAQYFDHGKPVRMRIVNRVNHGDHDVATVESVWLS